MSQAPNSRHPIPVRVGDVLAEKYCVERILGMGGMGFVVAARNIHLGKTVALKMMLPYALTIPLAVERFEREARAAVQLKSEHIAEVLDIGRLADGSPYIVMELLEGKDFEQVLRTDGWLRAEDAVDYILQACEAVAEAHSFGVVHRDLKPRNMFLAHRLDGTPVVKVLDFGISKWTRADAVDSHELTGTSDVIGSPLYMSPEQIRSAKDVDARTDIWSLGVILYELLTGQAPFIADSLPALCALVLEKPASLVSSVRADVPEGVVAIVARCLEKSRDHRFQSVTELAHALEPFANRPLHRTTGPHRPRSDAPSGASPVAATLMIDTGGSGVRRGVVGGGPTPTPTPMPRALLSPMMPTPMPPPPMTQTPMPSPQVPAASNAANISWAETLGMRRHRRVVGALVVMVPIVLLAAITALWLGPGGRWVTAWRTAHHDPPIATTSSTPTTTLLDAAAPTPTTSGNEPVPSASASTLVDSTLDAGPPHSIPSSAHTPPGPPTPTRIANTSGDAGRALPIPSLAPSRSAAPLPSNDPFNPIDRK